MNSRASEVREKITPVENISADNEIRVFGIRRSGNHAIISWIIDNYPGIVVFVNNINHGGTGEFPASPFDVHIGRPFVDRIVVKGLPYWRCKNKLTSWLKYLIDRPSQFSLVPSDRSVNLAYLRGVKKDLFMYSFENLHPKDSRLDLFEQEHDKYLGISRKKIDLLVLRDPYNLFASLLKSGYMKPNEEDKLRYINWFKGYAQEFIRKDNSNTSNRICANYNQWFTDASYRIALAENLGFVVKGNAYQIVSDRGNGSSFDKLEYYSNAASMQVLERWKTFKDDPFYRSIFSDRELRELSQEIFGNLTSDFG